jgi:hypothetical protein
MNWPLPSPMPGPCASASCPQPRRWCPKLQVRVLGTHCLIAMACLPIGGCLNQATPGGKQLHWGTGLGGQEAKEAMPELDLLNGGASSPLNGQGPGRPSQLNAPLGSPSAPPLGSGAVLGQ